MMLLGEQTWPNSLQTSSTGNTGWARGRPTSTTTCHCCPPQGGRKHSHHGYTANSQGLRILQPPACLYPRITDLGIESWASAALICSTVQVVWAGSWSVCSTSCPYFFPLLPCLAALPMALPIGNGLLLYRKFSQRYCVAATLPVPK